MEIFGENGNFWRKWKFSEKPKICGEKSNFWRKWKFLEKNINSGKEIFSIELKTEILARSPI